MAKTHLITPDDIGFEKVKGGKVMSLEDVKRVAIIEAINNGLKISDSSVTKTAKLLGIDRKTIQRYMIRYNIEKKRS